MPGEGLQSLPDMFAQEGTDIAVRSPVAVVDVLGDTAGEDDVVNLIQPIMPERGRDHELSGERGRGAVLNHLDKHFGHQSRAGLFFWFGYFLPECNTSAEFVHEGASGSLDACHHIGRVKGDQPGSDVDRRGLRHVPMFNERELRRAASHVHIEDRLALALREIDGAGTIGGEERLVVVTRRGADEFPGILRKVRDDWLGVFLLEGLAGDNDRSRVDIVRCVAGPLGRRWQ